MPTSVYSATLFTSFEDFKEKKIRAPNDWWLKLLEGAGALGVNISESECYMSLQTGEIYAVYTDLYGIFAWKMYEPATNVFLTKELWTPIFM